MSMVRGRARSMSTIRAMRPGRGVMATTRSASRMASVILCVTKITVFLSASQMRISSKPSSSRVMASSAANGSSISRTDGLWISARQSETRCCMPPESSRGKRFSKPRKTDEIDTDPWRACAI